MLERLLSPFLAVRDARAVAVFRMAFYFGLLLHFGPSLVFLDENFAPDVVRWQMWSATLFHALPQVSLLVLRVLSLLLFGAIGCGLVGFWPRVSAVATFALTYVFASFNALPVQTLALVNAWAVLPILCVADGAAAVWSLDAWRARRHGRVLPAPTVLGSLVVWQVLLAFFFAAVEKWLWGWAANNEMAMLLKTPRGYILRDWVYASPLLASATASWLMTWGTIVVEIVIPALALWRRTRVLAVLGYELFFVGIVAAIEVPPLFFLMFASALPIILSADDWHDVGAFFRRILNLFTRQQGQVRDGKRGQ